MNILLEIVSLIGSAVLIYLLCYFLLGKKGSWKVVKYSLITVVSVSILFAGYFIYIFSSPDPVLSRDDCTRTLLTKAEFAVIEKDFEPKINIEEYESYTKFVCENGDEFIKAGNWTPSR
jgi:hypothetical protein